MTKHFDDKLFELLEEKQQEVVFLTPQNLGILTPWYKKITHPLKYTPWKVFLPLALLLAFAMMIILGPLTVKMVSVLQSSF